MDPSSLNFSPGITFSNKVLSQFGSPVISPFPDDAHNFWLLASFARSKLKLTVNNVGHILQSILGGVATEFSVVEIKDWIFKFTVFSRDVGLFVYKLGVVDNPLFKLAFNLWNERGMTLAESFISVSQGPQYHWVQVRSKKDKCSFAEVVRSPPLTGANRISLGAQSNFFNRSALSGSQKSALSRLNSEDLIRNLHVPPLMFFRL